MSTETHAQSMLDRLAALDRAIVPKRFHNTSDWWGSTIAQFYESGKRTLVLRVGRRGGKSSTICRVAVVEALFGDHDIPAGDVGIVGIVSVNKTEADRVLGTIKAILDAIDVPYRKLDGAIELVNRPMVFRTFAATRSAVVGGTWIMGFLDEVAYWRDDANGANPASEVIAAIAPTLSSMPHSKLFMTSAPLGLDDAHAKAFARGDTDHQMIAHAPTWIARPSMTEADTHTFENDHRTWSREFAAIPIDEGQIAFEGTDLERAFVQRDDATMTPMAAKFGLVDLSSGKHDGACAAMAAWRADKKTGQPILHVFDVEAYAAPFDPKKTLKAITHFFFRHGHSFEIYGDAHESWALIQALEGRRKIKFTELRTTSSSKQAAVARIQGWLSNGTLLLPNNELAKAQMATFATSDGRKFAARGKSAHDDFVSLLVAAATADEKGLLHGSPNDYTPQTAMRQACVKAAAMDRVHKGSGAGRLQLSEWVLNKLIRVQ